jgi:hypothetical protein
MEIGDRGEVVVRFTKNTLTNRARKVVLSPTESGDVDVTFWKVHGASEKIISRHPDTPFGKLAELLLAETGIFYGRDP